MVSHLSLAAAGPGHLNMSTTVIQTKHSGSFSEATTHLQVRETKTNILLSDFIWFTLILICFFTDFYTNDAPVQFGGLQPGVVKVQDSPIERDLHLSLDDLFHGCTKKIKISRRVRATVLSKYLFSSHSLWVVKSFILQITLH